ncbi:30S ribosomal protein S3 [Candidatus Parcubacteria bacterium]|nr:30S ribosomal protein S3 [Candidatus Parcubacteria bacterium]
MSHKVHPKAFRIKETADWDSRWFSKDKIPQYLEEDFRIREFLENKLKECGLESIKIERFPGKLCVIISTSRPGLVIGRGGTGVEDLKKVISKQFVNKSEKPEVKIDIKEIKDYWAKSKLVGEWAASQFKKRVRYRKIIKQSLEKMMSSPTVKGARIQVAGRLDGSEIARKEWLKRGSLPRQTLRADIDYAECKAVCIYGVIGIKVWIYKGEKF